MITVDDVNSTLQRYAHMNMFHTIDTGLIGTFEFSDVHYDFVNVGHSISGANHTFTFEVVNSNWTGGFYVLDSNGDYLNVSYTYSDDVLSITTTESSIQLVLYCRHYQPAAFNVVKLKFKTNTPGVIYKQGYGAETCRIYYTNLSSSTLYFQLLPDYNEGAPLSITTGSDDDGTYIEFSITDRMWQGYILSGYTGSVGGTLVGTFFFKISVETYTPKITVDNPVIVGKNNKVLVNAPKAGPYMKGKIYYNDTVVDLQYSSYDGYFFMLDLTDKNDDRDVIVTFEIDEYYYITGASFDLRLDCQYIRVADENNLLIELESGAKIIELSDDIQLTNTLNITHDVLIIGNGHTFDVDTYNIIANANVKISDIVFENGQPVFVQKKNSKLELTGCRFNSAKISSERVTASVVYCDIDVESLANPSDYVTVVNDCFFYNCENACIFHGGELSVTDSKYFCDLTSNEVYPNNPAFLYQVDGDASIIGSVFDIDVGDGVTVLCENTVNLEYAQAIFMCGETATVNNASYIDLNREDNVNFFNQPYNNLAHIFADYYYAKIDDCVYVSPTLGDEDKAMCYCVSGVDWVFKKNVQVTRKGWGTENTTRKIIWEE